MFTDGTRTSDNTSVWNSSLRHAMEGGRANGPLPSAAAAVSPVVVSADLISASPRADGSSSIHRGFISGWPELSKVHSSFAQTPMERNYYGSPARAASTTTMMSSVRRVSPRSTTTSSRNPYLEVSSGHRTLSPRSYSAIRHTKSSVSRMMAQSPWRAAAAASGRPQQTTMKSPHDAARGTVRHATVVDMWRTPEVVLAERFSGAGALRLPSVRSSSLPSEAGSSASPTRGRRSTSTAAPPPSERPQWINPSDTTAVQTDLPHVVRLFRKVRTPPFEVSPKRSEHGLTRDALFRAPRQHKRADAGTCTMSAPTVHTHDAATDPPLPAEVPPSTVVVNVASAPSRALNEVQRTDNDETRRAPSEKPRAAPSQLPQLLAEQRQQSTTHSQRYHHFSQLNDSSTAAQRAARIERLAAAEMLLQPTRATTPPPPRRPETHDGQERQWVRDAPPTPPPAAAAVSTYNGEDSNGRGALSLAPGEMALALEVLESQKEQLRQLQAAVDRIEMNQQGEVIASYSTPLHRRRGAAQSSVPEELSVTPRSSSPQPPPEPSSSLPPPWTLPLPPSSAEAPLPHTFLHWEEINRPTAEGNDDDLLRQPPLPAAAVEPYHHHLLPHHPSSTFASAMIPSSDGPQQQQWNHWMHYDDRVGIDEKSNSQGERRAAFRGRMRNYHYDDAAARGLSSSVSHRPSSRMTTVATSTVDDAVEEAIHASPPPAAASYSPAVLFPHDWLRLQHAMSPSGHDAVSSFYRLRQQYMDRRIRTLEGDGPSASAVVDGQQWRRTNKVSPQPTIVLLDAVAASPSGFTTANVGASPSTDDSRFL